MLLSKYDLYDLYAVLLAVKRAPDAAYNARVFAALDTMLLSASDVHAEPNAVRTALREVPGLDRDHFGFVFVQNKYTYGQSVITSERAYRILQSLVLELARCAEAKHTERLASLAAATCRIPLLLAENPPFLRRRIYRACAPYKRKYKEDLARILLK